MNTAGECTLAILSAMATFTGLDDCALHACLQYGRTFPDQPYVFNANGGPNWPGGRMLVPAMRNYYALRSLDEIYQAVWRTAVRNDRPVEAVVVLTDPHWLTALWRTVMPRMHLESAYKQQGGTELVSAAGLTYTYTWDFVQDDAMMGLQLIEAPPGTEIPKRVVATMLGYNGDRAFQWNRDAIMALLGPFFEAGRTNRVLRRRG